MAILHIFIYVTAVLYFFIKKRKKSNHRHIGYGIILLVVQLPVRPDERLNAQSMGSLAQGYIQYSQFHFISLDLLKEKK